MTSLLDGRQDPSIADSPSLEEAVLNRYRAAASAVEPGLCCPIRYDTSALQFLPQEIIDKDYGCGDPSRYVTAGERVVDLGSGGGKICYILAQKVGKEGHVIGVDFNDTMLALARKYQHQLAQQFGYANVEFRKGKIQDLRLDLEAVDTYLSRYPIQSSGMLSQFEDYCEQLRCERPLIPATSVDVVVSNCVLNLVNPEDKANLFGEIFRVLKNGGRALIADIVSDEPVPSHLVQNRELWSGCLSGAFQEKQFLEMFATAGFHGIEIVDRQDKPWQVIEGIEFRSMTVRAFKGKEGPCWERNQAVIYTGPFAEVRDDDGHSYLRGERMAVCDKTYRLLLEQKGPYSSHFLPIEPRTVIPLDTAQPFDCSRSHRRDPQETKGIDYSETTDAATGCCPPGKCC